MNLATLRLEVRSRLNGPGYRFLSDTRLNTFINQAREQVDRSALWPYRRKTTTGTAPFAIADLDQIEKVIDQSNSSSPLSKVDYQTLVEQFGDLSRGGSPAFYYVSWASATPTLTVYPTASHTLSVTYWAIQSDLALDADLPLAPADFHPLICDLATMIALRANREHREADEYQQHADRQLQAMLSALPPGTADGPDFYIGNTYSSEDW